jgi:flagellar L-ring protein FlgH
MPTNSFNSLPAKYFGWTEGRTVIKLHRCRPSFGTRLSLLLAVFATIAGQGSAMAKKKPELFLPSSPPTTTPIASQGAIFAAGGYAPLTSGARAAQIGDILTVVLMEHTSASKTSSAATDRTGSFGVTPPTTGPLSFLSSSDVNSSGNQSFKGKGESAQSNSLSGEVSVTVAVVYPNGTMLVRGEKQLTLNHGAEHIQISGLVRSVDIGPDNRIASTRVANARIFYTGKGDVSRASSQGWLQSFFSKISPF